MLSDVFKQSSSMPLWGEHYNFKDSLHAFSCDGFDLSDYLYIITLLNAFI